MFAWRSYPVRGDASPGAYLTVPALRSAGIRASFTARAGGSDADRMLDLSLLSGRSRLRVLDDRARALATVGAGPDRWTSGAQVHGSVMARVGAADMGAGADDPSTTLPGVDAIWTDEPGIALVVLVADCVPILLADPVRRRIAVVHAGWRGLVAGIPGDAAAGFGDVSDVSAFIGPSIGPCCYEVGEDVSTPAADALGEDVIVRGARVRLDLWRGARVALARAGIGSIFDAALCTRCEPHRFFSHRAGDTGRQGLIAMIEPRGGAVA